MKRFVILMLLMALLLVGCEKNHKTPTVEATDPEQTTSTTTVETSPTPEMLIGAWRSLDPGELDMVETIEFFEDGSITVNCVYQGRDAGTIYGTYYIMGELLHCDMTSQGTPYILDYRFEIDGRELILYDDDGPANYIKVS